MQGKSKKGIIVSPRIRTIIVEKIEKMSQKLRRNALRRLIAALALPAALLSGCHAKSGAQRKTSAAEAQRRAAEAAEYRAAQEEAARIAAALDDRQLAAQVIISGIDGRGQLGADMRLLLSECPAGGIMLFRYNLDAGNAAIQNLIAESSALIAEGSIAVLPPTDGTKPTVSILPFAATDHEGGSVNRFRQGVADLPPAASYWEAAQDVGHENAVTQIGADSFSAGTAIAALGINLNFAPVAEPLNAANADFLDDRSYGPDPDFVSKAAAACIVGMERAGVLCAAKHFPGSAGADPHRYPSVLTGGRDDLAELASPFAALIQDGRARAIMVSHSLAPARDSENIASLSPQIMDGWLRQELKFTGLIICDDFSMSAAGNTRPETLAVRSLAAGADMVLVWPPDLRRTHRAIINALDGGTLSRERLREAAQRIIFEKLRMGLVVGESTNEHE